MITVFGKTKFGFGRYWRYEYSNFFMDYRGLDDVSETERADYKMFRTWARHVEYMIDIYGQHIALHDEDFVPLCDIFPDRLEATTAINEVGECAVTFSVGHIGEPQHPAVGWLIGKIRQNSAGQIRPETSLPRYIIVSRKNSRQVYRVEYVTLSGVDRPTALTVHGTDLMGYFSRLPLMSLPESWRMHSQVTMMPLLLAASQATYSRSAVFSGFSSSWDGKPVADGNNTIKRFPVAHVLGRPSFARVYDKATAYGPPAATIWRLLRDSLQGALETYPQFVAMPIGAKSRVYTSGPHYNLQGYSAQETADFWNRETHSNTPARYSKSTKRWRIPDAMVHGVTDFGHRMPRGFALKPAPAERDRRDLVAIRPTDGYILDELKTYLEGAGLRLTAELMYRHEANRIRGLWMPSEQEYEQLMMPLIVFGLEWI